MLSKKGLNKYLSQLSKEDLIEEIEKLHSKFKQVQEFYQLELGNDTSKLLKDYKKKLDKIFSPKGLFLNPSMAEANKVIKEFSKVSVHIADTIDIMLYKAELSIRLFEEWGHEFPSVINSFITGYDKVVGLIHESNLEDYFRQRCEEIETYGLNYGLINEPL
ncbi:MAG TPA: DUF6155 family protein [Chitinophagaceae bacterium]|jgi:hypothetical protein